MIIDYKMGMVPGRTLTSAWIETEYPKHDSGYHAVALSRVRGLKLLLLSGPLNLQRSHSHECVD